MNQESQPCDPALELVEELGRLGTGRLAFWRRQMAARADGESLMGELCPNGKAVARARADGQGQ